MFGWFGKKKDGINVHDKIFMSEDAKFKACLDLKKGKPHVIFVAWFEDTRRALSAYFQKNQIEAEVYMADRLTMENGSKELIFVEHHPLSVEEEEKAKQFGKTEITVYSSLTEPLFKVFNADRLVDMMKKMGMQEYEMIEHDLVSKSIKKAQESIASRNVINSSNRSQADWLLNAGINQPPL